MEGKEGLHELKKLNQNVGLKNVLQLQTLLNQLKPYYTSKSKENYEGTLHIILFLNFDSAKSNHPTCVNIESV